MRGTIISVIVMGFLALFICMMFFPYAFDKQQSEYQKQCMDRHMNDSPYLLTGSMMECTIGNQYPERLPDPERDITIKSIKPLWFGDCKVLTDTDEILHSSNDRICMALPGDVVHVRQMRDIENEVTNIIYMEDL
jgi:hypothetical protein